MSNKKQSSVEFAIEKITQFMTEQNDFELGLIAEKLKAMHKEEVISFNTQFNQHEIDALTNNTKLLTREEFYHETFGGDK